MEHQALLSIRCDIFRCKIPKGFSHDSSMKTGIYIKMSLAAFLLSVHLWLSLVKKLDIFKKTHESSQLGSFMRAPENLA